MPYYANFSGESSVRRYQIEEYALRVWFHDGSQYLYTWASAGKANVERAKQLAFAGAGLCRFLHRAMKYSYAEKG